MIRDVMALIQAHEALSLKVYTDTTGHESIGWGHNLGDGITQSQADIIFRDDFYATWTYLSGFDWFQKLDNVRQAAIADVTFDIRHEIENFVNMIDALSKQDWQRAHNELLNSLFAKQTGRRAVEDAQILLNGSWPST